MELVDRLISDGPYDVPNLLRAAIEQQDAITPALLGIIDRDVKRFDELRANPEYAGHIYAIFLLAQFREPKAYPLIVRFFSDPNEDYHDIFGDMVTEDLPQILASVYDGNDDPLYGLIEDGHAYEYCRIAALDALQHLVAMGVKTREAVLAYINELLTFRLEKEESALWGFVVDAARMLHPAPCMEAIRAAFAADLIDPIIVRLRDIEIAAAKDPSQTWKGFRPQYHAPVTDVPGMFEVWEKERNAQERRNQKSSQGRESAVSTDGTEYAANPEGNVVRVHEKVGPNAPCPCGSGRKYKKCCGRLD